MDPLDQAESVLGSIRGNQFDSQTSAAAHQLGIEKARAAAEERRAEALMTAATAELIIDSLKVRSVDVVDLLDAAVARTAMRVLNGEVPIRNGSDAAAVIREFTAARVRIAGDHDGRLDDADLRGANLRGADLLDAERAATAEPGSASATSTAARHPSTAPTSNSATSTTPTAPAACTTTAGCTPTTPKPTGGTDSDEPDPSRTDRPRSDLEGVQHQPA